MPPCHSGSTIGWGPFPDTFPAFTIRPQGKCSALSTLLPFISPRLLKVFYRQIRITPRTHRRQALLFVVLLAASLTWTGCDRKETFRIGLAGASTGIFYISWQTFYEGAQLAASEINSQGGVLGRPVELFPTDDQVKVDLGVSEMKKLILRDQVHIVVGGSSSHVGAAQSGIALRYRLPYIIANCNSAVLAEDKGHRYLFQLTPSSRMEAHAVTVFVAKQGWEKICYIMPDYEWGHTFKRVIDEKLVQIAPETETLGEFWPKIDEPEYASYITAILAAKPDAVINGLGGASIINFTKQAIGYGLFESLPVIGIYDLNTLKALGQDMPEGAVGFHRVPSFQCPDPEWSGSWKSSRRLIGITPPPTQSSGTRGFTWPNSPPSRPALSETGSESSTLFPNSTLKVPGETSTSVSITTRPMPACTSVLQRRTRGTLS